MNCWLVFIEDCSRPCNCVSEHPLVLNSNPGINKDDNVIIVDEETRVPCCMATVNNIKFSVINNTPRIYIYLKDCKTPSENSMYEIMRVIRSVSYMIKIMNISQNLCGYDID